LKYQGQKVIFDTLQKFSVNNFEQLLAQDDDAGPNLEYDEPVSERVTPYDYNFVKHERKLTIQNKSQVKMHELSMAQSRSGVPLIKCPTPKKETPIWVTMDTPIAPKVEKPRDLSMIGLKQRRKGPEINPQIIIDKKRLVRYKQLKYTEDLLKRNG